MSLGVIISSAALIISLLVTAVKFVDWLSHSDPRSIVRMGRLGLLALAIAALPFLMALLALQEWTWAMLLAAAMLLSLVLVNWRRLLPRHAFKPLWTDDPGYGPPQAYEASRYSAGPDPELARRAAIVLQDYLALEGRSDGLTRLGGKDGEHARSATDGPLMGLGEATALLGLQPGASASQIRAAHRRLMQRVHPDHGGTDYLAMQINRAKDILLATAPGGRRSGGDERQAASRKTPAGERPPARKRAPRAARDDGSAQPAGPHET